MNTVADPNCYGCLGTGRIVGFSGHASPCACVAECQECGAEIAWAHDDERGPRTCEACTRQHAQYLARNAAVAAP